MKVFEFDDTEACARALASALENAIGTALANRPRASLALSGGRSPRAVLPLLAAANVEWSCVDVTLTDERCVPPGDPDSNQQLIDACFFAKGADRASFRPLWSAAGDPGGVLAEANAQLAKLPLPLDVVYLGMGPDGHFASLFPADDAATFDGGPGPCVLGRAPMPPHDRISLSLPTILAARRLFLHVTGTEKRRVLERALAIPPSPALPVSLLLQAGHPSLEVFAV